MKNNDNVKYVVCKICGKKGRILTSHLRVKHNMTRKEYEDIYKSPAVCYERQLIQIEKNKKLNEMLETNPYYVDLMKKVRKRNGNLPQVQIALQNGHKEYYLSDKGKKRNSEIMINNHKNCDMQNKATQGKINSQLYHDVHSKILSQLNRERFSDEEYKKQYMKKLYDSSKKEYIDCENNTVYFRSSWELKLHNYLITNNIKYLYESLKISYSCNGKNHTYTPDFYLVDYNVILEVKPKMFVSNNVNQIKRQKSLEAGFKHLFVTEKELSDLNSFFHNKVYK